MNSILSTKGSKTDAMNDMLANNWWVVALRGVVAILFGIAAFAMPVVTMLSLVVTFGVFSVVDGVCGLIMSVRGARKGSRWIWLLLSGLLGVVAGAAAILWPGITAVGFVILVAAWALISGTSMLISAIRLKLDHGRIWLVIGGLACIAFGILLGVSPFVGALVLTLWTGAHALVLGITLLVLAFRLRSHRTDLPREFAASGTT